MIRDLGRDRRVRCQRSFGESQAEACSMQRSIRWRASGSCPTWSRFCSISSIQFWIFCGDERRETGRQINTADLLKS